ncbi:MAG: ABC transporter permease [Pseudoclavibacter sp.]
MRFVASVAGVFREALDELRVHRTRVFLSLIGVLIAVCSITTVTGLGELVRQSALETSDRYGGRPASYTVQFSPTGAGGQDETRQRFEQAFDSAVERYGISFSSREQQTQLSMQFPDGVQQVATWVVDPPYGEMRRIDVAHGAWFAADDADRLAPAVVINDAAWQAMGAPDLRTHPTIEVADPASATAVVIGVLPPDPYGGDMREAYLLTDAFGMLGADTADPMYGGTGYSLWLPPEAGDELSERIESDLTSALGDTAAVTVMRTDYLGQGGGDPFLAIQILINVISSIVLAIGAVGYINLAIVTVSQRIREIGIRRSFGATSGRVFVSVLLESVVGTTIAGIVGIALAVVILQNPIVQAGITGGTGASDTVPFPVVAAITGLAVSVSVGLIAGLIPAVIAMKVRVIDAIRSA